MRLPIQQGEDFFDENAFDVFAVDIVEHEAVGGDGDVDALMQVGVAKIFGGDGHTSGALAETKTSLKLDVVLEMVLVDDGLQGFDHVVGALEVARTADTNFDNHIFILKSNSLLKNANIQRKNDTCKKKRTCCHI